MNFFLRKHKCESAERKKFKLTENLDYIVNRANNYKLSMNYFKLTAIHKHFSSSNILLG